MKKQIKKNIKGITLIALVITIVILLILAGVSLNLVLGNNGIISKAKDSKEAQRAATIDDKVEIWNGEKEIAQRTGTGDAISLDDFLNQLQNEGLLTGEEKEEVKHTGRLTIGNKTIVFGSTTKTLVEMFDSGELEVGTYINYINPTSGQYISYGTTTGMQAYKDAGNDVLDEQLNQVFNVDTTMKWRVLGKDEKTGGLKLIAETPITKESNNSNGNYYLYGASGYTNGVTELNNICSIYKNEYAIEARSATMEDIDKLVGATEEKINQVNTHTNYKASYNFENQYTPESWLNNKTTATVSGTDNYYFYLAGNIGELSTSVKEILEGNQTDYYLASKCTVKTDNYAHYGLRYATYAGSTNIVALPFAHTFTSSSGEGILNGYKVRPVVVLKPYVTKDDLETINLDDWIWEVDAATNTVTIRGYKGKDTVVTIPSSINKIPVKKISNTDGVYTFWDKSICESSASNGGPAGYVQSQHTITKVIISDGIEEIDGSFQYSYALQEVIMPDSVKTLKNQPFKNCTSLNSIRISNNATSLGGSYAFYCCNALRNITIPGSVEKIDDDAFSSGKLTNVTIEQGVKAIGNSAFSSNTSLTNVTIPSSVTTMGSNVFYSYNTATTITVNVPFKEGELPAGWNSSWANSKGTVIINYAK